MKSLLQRFGKRYETILGLIRQLVEIESKSGDEVALNRVAELVMAHLRPLSESGGRVELLPESGYGAHVRASFPFGREGEPHLLVIGHLDTVWPAGTLERKPFTVTEDGRATGPGIFDMKAGVAILIEALRAIVEESLPMRRPLHILLTCDEEIGSRRSRWYVEEEARGAAAALVLEPPLPGGVVKTGRKGIGTFTVRAVGRAAHAGLDPRSGVNAIVELAHQTIELAAMNDDKRGVTVNVGLVEGGTGLNVVPAAAEARVDLRFWEPADGERAVDAIRGLTPRLKDARLEVTGGVNRPAMPRSEGNLALYAIARDIAAEIGIELREGAVGGGSDGNFTAALGVPTLDGLGVDGAGAHAENEHILVADIPRRTALLTRLLQSA